MDGNEKCESSCKCVDWFREGEAKMVEIAWSMATAVW